MTRTLRPFLRCDCCCACRVVWLLAAMCECSGLTKAEAVAPQLQSPRVCNMQECLLTGKLLLIENIEEDLDPILDPLLEKRFLKQAGGLVLRLGDREVTLCSPTPCCLLLPKLSRSAIFLQSCRSTMVCKIPLALSDVLQIFHKLS